jgi:hypothetical protein
MKTLTRCGQRFALRILLVLIPVLSVLGVTAGADESGDADFTVYKNAQCMCCDKWAEHMRQAEYSVAVESMVNVSPIKEQFGIEPRYQSCHTAVHGETGLVFEGHVPAAHITALIEDHSPEDKGLSVPGMPAGSPGMEVGSRKDPYEVLLLREKSEATIFAHENGPVR